MRDHEFRYDYGLNTFLAQNNICYFVTNCGEGENEEITYYIQTTDQNRVLIFIYKGCEDDKVGCRFVSMFYLFRSIENLYEDCIEALFAGVHFTFMNVYEGKNVFDFKKGKIVSSLSCTNEEEGSEEE